MIDLKRTVCAAGLLLLSTGVASALPARAETDLNVRAGQGTPFPVIGMIPAGAIVEVSGCADGWCFVHDYGGFAHAGYLDIAGGAYGAVPPAYIAPSATIVVRPGPYYRRSYYDWDDRRRFRRAAREIRRDIREDRRDIRGRRDGRESGRERRARQEAHRDANR